MRPILPGDSEQVFAYRSDAETNKYQGWIPEKMSDVDRFISKNPKAINTPDTWFQLVILERDSNHIIGDIGIHFIGNDNQQCEIGCTLNKEFQGKGLATEALKEMMGYLFNVLKKHRIIASIDPRNTASIKLIERLGFRKEAHFRKSLWLHGEWVDDIVYAVLKSEWKSRNE